MMESAPGDYMNTGEYLRNLVRMDQSNDAPERLRSLIADGLGSGHGRPFDESVHAELRARALSRSE